MRIRIASGIPLLVVSLVAVSPSALRAQESLCSKGAELEVKIDGRWWPGHVESAPANGQCAVTHHAYFGTENTSWVTFDKIRARGTVDAAATTAVPPAVAPARIAPRAAPTSQQRRQPVPAPAAAPVTAARPVPPRNAGGGAEAPRGIYMLVDGMGNLHYRTFLPGAFVFSGVPTGGADAFSVADAQAGDPRYLGSYSLGGGTLTINWGGGAAAETKTYATRGADVLLNGSPYRAIRTYPADHRIEGRYTTRVYNSMGVAGGGTMAWGGASTVTFHRDGTFESARGGMASTSAGNGAAASSGDVARGRYTIRGNTITFVFADGSVQRALIHPWNGEERATSPSSLNLNGHTYTRS